MGYLAGYLHNFLDFEENDHEISLSFNFEGLENMQADCGFHHSLLVDKDNNAWSFGSNCFGQLGFASNERNVKQPTKVAEKNIVAVSAGWHHSLFLSRDGTVYSCGWNSFSQLGLGDNVQRNKTEKIEKIPPITSVAAGSSHSLFLDITGNVWSCGNNEGGECGQKGEKFIIHSPAIITNLPPIKQIAAGRSHSLLLDKNGQVWAFGNNENGQLGVGDKTNRTGPEKLPLMQTIQAVSAGGSHSLFLTTTNKVLVCGDNACGQLGLAANCKGICSPTQIQELPQIVSVAAGNYHSLLLDIEGKIWGFGSNKSGALGHNKAINYYFPEKVEGVYPKMKQLAAGSENFSLFLTQHGSFWSCGTNQAGQIGIEEQYSFSPTQIILLCGAESPAAQQQGKSVPHQKPEESEWKKAFTILENNFLCYTCFSPTGTVEPFTCSAENVQIIKDKRFVHSNFVQGNISMSNWQEKYNLIQQRQIYSWKKKLELEIAIKKYEDLIEQTKITIEEHKRELKSVELEHANSNILKEVIEPVAYVENQLRELVRQKVEANIHLEQEEVSLFLNIANLSDLIPIFHEKKINGKNIGQFKSSNELNTIGVNDVLLGKKFLYANKLLENRAFFKKSALENCPIVSFSATPEKTLDYLRDMKIIGLNERLISEHKIFINQLIFFSAADLMHIFQISLQNAMEISQKLSRLLFAFDNYLKSVN